MACSDFLYNEGGSPIGTTSEFVDLTDGYGLSDDPEAYTGPEYGSTHEELWISLAFVLRVQSTNTT